MLVSYLLPALAVLAAALAIPPLSVKGDREMMNRANSFERQKWHGDIQYLPFSEDHRGRALYGLIQHLIDQKVEHAMSSWYDKTQMTEVRKEVYNCINRIIRYDPVQRRLTINEAEYQEIADESKGEASVLNRKGLVLYIVREVFRDVPELRITWLRRQGPLRSESSTLPELRQREDHIFGSNNAHRLTEHGLMRLNKAPQDSRIRISQPFNFEDHGSAPLARYSLGEIRPLSSDPRSLESPRHSGTLKSRPSSRGSGSGFASMSAGSQGTMTTSGDESEV